MVHVKRDNVAATLCDIMLLGISHCGNIKFSLKYSLKAVLEIFFCQETPIPETKGCGYNTQEGSVGRRNRLSVFTSEDRPTLRDDNHTERASRPRSNHPWSRRVWKLMARGDLDQRQKVSRNSSHGDSGPTILTPFRRGQRACRHTRSASRDPKSPFFATVARGRPDRCTGCHRHYSTAPCTPGTLPPWKEHKVGTHSAMLVGVWRHAGHSICHHAPGVCTATSTSS